MRQNEREFIHTECPRCRSSGPLECVASHNQVQAFNDERLGLDWDAGPIWKIVVCPAGRGVSFLRLDYHSAFDSNDWRLETVCPLPDSLPLGLPDKVSSAYREAQAVRHIGGNAYGVLLRRVLEIVCIDRKAEGTTLDQQLGALATRGEMPKQWADLAHQLRQFGNIGAHASLGELTEAEAPVLNALCRAVLEYVYAGPALRDLAQSRLQQLKARRTS